MEYVIGFVIGAVVEYFTERIIKYVKDFMTWRKEQKNI